MNWNDISELREAIGNYLYSYGYFRPCTPDDEKRKSVERIHLAIDRIELDGITNCLEDFNLDQTSIVDETKRIFKTVEDLRQFVLNNMIYCKRYDPNIRTVIDFCKKFGTTWEIVEDYFNKRIAKEPTTNDLKAVEMLECFCEGDYGDITFETFLSVYIMKDILPDDDIATERRLNHLIEHCEKEDVKRALEQRLTKHKEDASQRKEEAQKRREARAEETSTATQQTPPPSNIPKAEKASTTDFSHMNTIPPSVEFDLSALYEFLTKKKVINNIDEKLFSDCISHAHINELWNCEHTKRKRKRNLLQCLFSMLSNECYPKEWIIKCSESLNLNIKQFTNPTQSGATDKFKDDLRAVLKGKSPK